MQYTLDDGKVIHIKDSEIQNYMDKLGITYNESVVLWLEDNGYQENQEQNQLEQKAKENRITATIHQARADTKKVKKSRPKKVDDDKKDLIDFLGNAIAEKVSDISVINDQRTLEFKYNNKWYKIDLIFCRNKQKQEEVT